ncbi:amino acid adenylation domain-containing protein [Nocardia sp. NPDC046473]|uniref:amino acid adenylation domain-containing protein n=1 Tax=Nocardia sp. NPDC046473 TaxID=3155733 RepID=UPI00340B6935
MVDEQARLTPDAVAVEAGDDRLTYRELIARADQLANFLRARGIGPDDLVGVCAERSPELVIALLGVWKAGAGYVPFDPAHPAERLEFMQRDTGVALTLTQSRLAHLVHDGVPLDDASVGIAEFPMHSAGQPVDPAGAAYAIYTSGSTGQPKGVVVSHEGIANRVRWTVRRHELGGADRVLQKTPLSFDAAGWEIFAPLVVGATVVMAPVGAERDPAALVRAVIERGATVLQGVPSVLSLLAGEPDWPLCSSLRLIFSAGEPLHAELAHRLLDPLGPDTELWNTFGPTECSIDITAHRFDRAQTTGQVPIGRPISGMRVLLLDAAGELAPIGVPGELFAGGPGVARGYLGRPELTAERFVPDPYGPAGARLYRTGDRARWRSDGILEFLGRLDDQVKIRGVRIEPGEVESVLTTLPVIRQAAVTVGTDRAGARQLVAYFVATQTITLGELRDYLRARLPDYSVPTVLVSLTELPRTSSGKLDRAALPDPWSGESLIDPEYVAPRTAEEHLVASLWSELLGIDRIGVHDDFYQRGGYSLMLNRLAGRLHSASGQEVALTELLASPTVAGQAALIATRGQEVSPVRPVERGASMPLSFGQQRLWLLDRLNPASAEYVVPLLLRVSADTSSEQIARALALLAQRHEVLRTRYPVLDGQPRQVIEREPVVELAEKDLGTAAGAALGQLFAAECARGFDLDAGPVWRALLVRTPGAEHLLILTIHHIACDGWSSALLEREFGVACAALRDGRQPEFAPMPVQYADYAVWQRDRLTGDLLDRQLAHWRSVLDGSTPLDLPTDRPRPAIRDARGGAVVFTVPPRLSRAVTELGRRGGATPYMTLLTAFATLLARYTGRWDIPVGAPVAGRLRPETEGVVGLFLNTLVIRCDLTGDPGFGVALDRVRRTALDAFAHQELPFERLVEAMQPERDLSRTPLYQVMFDLHDEGFTAPTADASEIDVLQQGWQTAKTDLMLVMHRDRDGSLGAVLEYAAALFDRESVERMARHFLTLLESVAAQPDAPISTVELRTAVERRQSLVEWNDTVVDRDSAGVAELFARQATATPDAVAIIDGRSPDAWTSRMTYAELNERAGHYARRLRAIGVGPESVVGVLMDRTPDLVACLIGVWQAGAAYVPLSPALPAERLAYMLGDSQATVVIAEAAHRELLPAANGATLLLASDGDAENAAGTAGLVPSGGELAYVIYTSGSTGRPKGVEVEHRALANLLLAMRDDLSAAPGDVWLAITALSFDISGLELFLPLISGGRVVLASAEQARDGQALLGLVDRHGVSHVQATPSGWKLLLQAGFDRSSTVALVGGEALSVDLARQLRARVGRLTNVYGPTETTIWSMAWAVAQAPDRVAIGRPLQNTTVYVVDENLVQVPVGVPGELLIGGAGLARGYRDLPERTAEQFIPDPFSPIPGSRLYRTGDLVKRHPDGTVEYLDRIDNQVKIRGHRIEPDEIALVLRTHPELHDALVVAAAVGTEQQLVAYCVPACPPGPQTELAVYCRTRLPDYMIPTVFVTIDEFPLNPSGKVDRKALPPAEFGSSPGERVALRGPVQERLAEIWSELLGGIRVDSARCNFFHTGGTSLLAARMVTEIHESFALVVPLRTVYEWPVLADLAEVLEAEIRAEIALLDDAEIAAYTNQIKEQTPS